MNKRSINQQKSKAGRRRRRRRFGLGGLAVLPRSFLPASSPSPSMRKLSPNLDREYGLETVLEVPVPEELFMSSSGSGGGGVYGSSSKAAKLLCSNMKAWMKPHGAASPPVSGRAADLQLMLGVIAAPLVPLPIQEYQSALGRNIKDNPIELSMARYIVQQYIAAIGGDHAVNSINSMYAMGKVWMAASDVPPKAGVKHGEASHKKVKKGGTMSGAGEMGGFVLWQNKPDLWCLELMVSGYKISAGSDGKVAWRQTPWQHSHASRGPPRPLRRSLQGLDPRATASLFVNSVCLGEKTVNGEDCFVLKLDAQPAALRVRSSSSVEIIRHTVWGYFSQRTGLLVQLEDSHLLRIRSPNDGNVYWETTMESTIEDYRPVDGVLIAHAGRTNTSLFRFGEPSDAQSRTRMEEMWTVEEFDFNLFGLTMDFFLPPGDLKEEKEGGAGDMAGKQRGRTQKAKVQQPQLVPAPATKAYLPLTKLQPGTKIGPSQVAAVDFDDGRT